MHSLQDHQALITEALKDLGVDPSTDGVAVYVAVSFMPDGSVGFFPVATGPTPEEAPEAAQAVAAGTLMEQAVLYNNTPIDYLRVYAVPAEQADVMVENPAWFVLNMLDDIMPLACNCGQSECSVPIAVPRVSSLMREVAEA
jgi:hypothetical protein